MTAAAGEPAGAGPLSRCIGCHGLVPDVEGPTHAYMQASPGCWRWYGEIGAFGMTTPNRVTASVYHVDCYAVQHPGDAERDRRQRQSVAVHLVSLCLAQQLGGRFEQGSARLSARRSRISERVLPRVGLTDWPYLAPPTDLGAVTVAEVHAAVDDGADPRRFAALLQDWVHSAWLAWSAHHDTVGVWAAAALKDSW